MQAIIIDSLGEKKVSLPGDVLITKGAGSAKIKMNGKCKKIDKEIESVFWLNILSAGVYGSSTDFSTGKMWKYKDTKVGEKNILEAC